VQEENVAEVNMSDSLLSNQLREELLEYILGKTIDSVGFQGNELFLNFTDKTITVLGIEECTNSHTISINPRIV
jgi:hypothetical protein